MHTHPFPFTFRLSKRQHGRPPRVFVICSGCAKELQAVQNADGTYHAFTTNRKRSDKRPRSFWINDDQAQKIRKMLEKGEI